VGIYYLCNFLPRGGLGRTRTAGRLAARLADLRGWLMKTEGGRERALRLPAVVPSMVTGVLVLGHLLILPRWHRPVPPCAWSSAHGAFVLRHSAHAHFMCRGLCFSSCPAHHIVMGFSEFMITNSVIRADWPCTAVHRRSVRFRVKKVGKNKHFVKGLMNQFVI
jgi:hypothetical protein